MKYSKLIKLLVFLGCLGSQYSFSCDGAVDNGPRQADPSGTQIESTIINSGEAGQE